MGVPTWRRLRPGRPLMCTSAGWSPRRWIVILVSCGCSGCRAAVSAVVGVRGGLPGPVRATYEAGPTGFVLARRLEAIGVDCLVCAPGLIPRARAIASRPIVATPSGWCGCWPPASCIAVTVPSVEEEALRDLVRAREDLRGDLMRARHRLAKLLLRHEVRFDGPQANWTQAHLGWLAGVRLDAAGVAAGVGGLSRRRRRVDDPPRATRDRDRPGVARLAVGADGAPVDVPARHRHPDRGRAVRRDRRLRPLRAPGAGHELSRRRAVRAFLRRAAPARPDHQVRQPARPPAAGRGRLALPAAAARRGQPRAPPTRRRAEILALSWKAQRRLHHVWQRMEQRYKRRTIIAVAAGRELAGFCWAVATAD